MLRVGFRGWWRQALVCLAVVGLQASRLAAGETSAAAWPKSIDTPQGRCTVFQPQPAELDGDRLRARAALAVAPEASTNVVFGIAELQARAVQDPDGQQTTIFEVVLRQASFAPANAPAMAGLADALQPELAKVTWTVPSEELRAGLDAVEREQTAARGINLAPPKILYRSQPAVLVLLDGPPQLRALTNSPMMRVVNTPYTMVYEPTSKRYWLQGSYDWFSAADWRGEWTAVAQPPTEVAAAVPQGTAANTPALGDRTSVPPRIVVATEPSELVITRGEPTYTPVAGSDLLYVSNSDQLLFFTLDTKEYYVGFSGRWYRSLALPGPWTTVASDQLPPAFAKISPGSPKSEALTYVAGTVEAQDAVLQANIPQITVVERGPANVEVKYDGAPQFQPVENTGVQYATNTVDAVFLVRGSYYMCRDAVWYTGPGPAGPWSVATFVPPEIQSLPPSNPHFNVKYVYIYGSTPQEVYVGYRPGYSGCYVYGPTVVYGTGWWYPGYYGPSYCWAYPATFGFGFGYNSWSGWSVGVGWGYGWLGCGYAWGWGGYYPWGWWGPRSAYWACAPRYPHYYGYHRGGGGYGGRGDYGRPPPGGRPGGGGGQAGPPPGRHPGGSRAEIRRDAPGLGDRPGNPQRRTLPTYARTAMAPSQPPTALRSARDIESNSNLGGQPNRFAPPTRSDIANRQPAMAPRTAPANGVTTGTAGRSAAPRTLSGGVPSAEPRAVAAQPARSSEARSSAAPTQSTPSSIQPSRANQPDRVSTTPRVGSAQASPRTPSQTAGVPANNWPGARPSATGSSTPAMTSPPPGRVSTSPAPSLNGRAPVSTSAPSPSAGVPANNWPGARPSATGSSTPAMTAPPPGRVSTSPAPSLNGRAPISTSAPSPSWPGATPRYAPSTPSSGVRPQSFASPPGYSPGPARAVAPAYGSMSSAPAMRAPTGSPSASMPSIAPRGYSAPARGGSSPGIGAPTMSAPMRSPGGFSGGTSGRGGPTRGR
jgi:hypothetical protein